MKKVSGFSFPGITIGKTDWKLLAFLLLFLNVKLVIKIAAVCLMYILRPDLKFRFSLKNSRLPLFYLLVILIAVLNWLIYGLFINFNYNLVLITGIFFWGLCILAIHQVKLSVEKNDLEVIHRTVVLFFIINAVVSVAVFAGIVWETGTINPYRYQGNYQKYFIGTGDYIKGLTFDTSTTNAVLNAFGVIYFLFRGKHFLCLLCMAVLLLTGSNITNLLLCITLIFIFFFRSSKDQKSIIIVSLFMLVTFLVKISPQNNEYIAGAVQKYFNIQSRVIQPVTPGTPITQMPDSLLSNEDKKLKFARLYMDSINASLLGKSRERVYAAKTLVSVKGYMEKPVIPKDSIHTPGFQYKNDTNAIKRSLIQYVEQQGKAVPISSGISTRPRLPGKLVALQQTARYFKEHPAQILTGTGIGNFSSKLAFRATSMKVTGGYPAEYTYISNAFRSNHLDLYLYYFSNKDDHHSVINSPHSTYGQLLGEYGIMGLISFIGFYILFFLKHVPYLTYAIPLLIFMLGAFFIEYWFEQLSVVVFFELLVLLNIKESTVNTIHETN